MRKFLWAAAFALLSSSALADNGSLGIPASYGIFQTYSIAWCDVYPLQNRTNNSNRVMLRIVPVPSDPDPIMYWWTTDSTMIEFLSVPCIRNLPIAIRTTARGTWDIRWMH